MSFSFLACVLEVVLVKVTKMARWNQHNDVHSSPNKAVLFAQIDIRFKLDTISTGSV